MGKKEVRRKSSTKLGSTPELTTKVGSVDKPKIEYGDLFSLETSLMLHSVDGLFLDLDYTGRDTGFHLDLLSEVPENSNRIDHRKISDEIVRIQRNAQVVRCSLWPNLQPSIYRTAHEAAWCEASFVSRVLFQNEPVPLKISNSVENRDDWFSRNSLGLLEKFRSYSLIKSEWTLLKVMIENEELLLSEWGPNKRRKGLVILKTVSQIRDKAGLEEIEKHHKEKIGVPHIPYGGGRKPASYNIADPEIMKGLKETFRHINFADWEAEVEEARRKKS